MIQGYINDKPYVFNRQEVEARRNHGAAYHLNFPDSGHQRFQYSLLSEIQTYSKEYSILTRAHPFLANLITLAVQWARDERS